MLTKIKEDANKMKLGEWFEKYDNDLYTIFQETGAFHDIIYENWYKDLYRVSQKKGN